VLLISGLQFVFGTPFTLHGRAGPVIRSWGRVAATLSLGAALFPYPHSEVHRRVVVNDLSSMTRSAGYGRCWRVSAGGDLHIWLSPFGHPLALSEPVKHRRGGPPSQRVVRCHKAPPATPPAPHPAPRPGAWTACGLHCSLRGWGGPIFGSAAFLDAVTPAGPAPPCLRRPSYAQAAPSLGAALVLIHTPRCTMRRQ
jgi:hypothetical protein